MSRFLNQRLAALDEYVPGEQPQDKKYIKLNTNESPYPPPQRVADAVKRQEIEDLRLYSDPECKRLRRKMAEVYGLVPENIFLSNGSDETLNFAFMAYGAGGAVFPDITYGFYSVFADLYGIKSEIIPLKSDFTVDVNAFCGKMKLVVIANPNAPTGILLGTEDVERIVSSNPDSIVIIDEAYIDFGGISALPLIKKYDNLLVVGTFSKSRSMAGARLGFGFADEKIIADLEKIRYSTNPYNINRLTLLCGEEALCCGDYYAENCRRIIETREYTAEKLKAMGFEMTDSKANFIFAKHKNIGGYELYSALKEKGVLVRHFGNERIKDYNRITVGSREEMEKFLEITAGIIGGKI